MRKKHLSLLVLALAGMMSLFVACDKDTDCYVTVDVIDIVKVTDSVSTRTDTLPVPGAFVKIDIDSSMVYSEGFTDETGTFRTVFAAPAIFNVAVKLNINDLPDYPVDKYNVYRRGSGTIRLQEGDTVFSTVILEKDTIILSRN